MRDGFRNAHRCADAPILRSDAEAIQAAHRSAAVLLPGALERDRHRRLPFAEIEQHSASGLGGVTVPKAYGGPDLSMATLAEVTAIIAAAAASRGQLPQNRHGFLRLLRYEPDRTKAEHFFRLALQGARFGNALAELGAKSTREVNARMRRVAEDWS